MSDTRRDFIKKAALLAGTAGLSNILPSSIQKALAINPAPGSTWKDAEHVVILMQENRSFDHCFGTLRGVRGFNDPHVIDLPNKNPVWLQSNEKGETYAPFHLDIKDTKATWMNSLPHSWSNQVNARNDGKFDQWLIEKESGNPEYKDMPLTLGYHTRQDLPFNYALADAFTICDQHFCSSLTGTTPNRNYLWTGTIRKEQNENSRANVWNEDSDFEHSDWTTFPERLEDAGISWKCYQNELSVGVGFEGEEDAWLSNFTDNNLEFFKQYHVRLHKEHIAYVKKRIAVLPAEIEALNKKIAALPAGDASIKSLNKQLKQLKAELKDIEDNKAILEPGAFEKLSKREQNLHLKAFNTNRGDADYHRLTTLTYDDNGTRRQMQVPKGDMLHSFRTDVKSGQLPMVSWITAPENFSDHPGAPWYGAWYVSEVLDILTQNPEVWKKTIFIVTYDENDGYFDHIPPFVAPHSHKPGTGKVSEGIDTRAEFVTLEQEKDRQGFPNNYQRESAIGLGYRVPMIIASPWSRGGYVNSEVFDHTSNLQFLEQFVAAKTGKKVTESNITNWRRTVCGDLTSVFRPYHGEKIASPKSLDKNTFVEGIHKAQFKALPTFKKLSTEDIEAIKSRRGHSAMLPKQESGTKPSCALPYELYADGGLNQDKTAFEMTLRAGNEVFGKKAAGAPFNVYAPGNYMSFIEPGKMEAVRTWSYAAKAGDTLIDNWPLADFENKRYHLRTYGPNGFFREFKGHAGDPGIVISPSYERLGKSLTGNLVITFSLNGTTTPVTVEITDNAYKTSKKQLTVQQESFAPQNIKLDLGKQHHWYDFTITVKGFPDFERHYAGRVETGAPSISDPQMSGEV
ncbi:phospholipase C, phosphocholine-specific [Mucilaginibacter sp. MD40]|uniref:phosphocholine-specific phospholipase C n=1 Tax=Mucilaginibacter sp. MD40 TaxID=2029590 RepID=UPI000BACE7E1|nr:phospholipase C, phosphocholine-specific [Mucilaginibacter sp. MD40]PAW93270.1 phospholipase C, phosphocholine-specific [Mucilaginibacter sp. MD40]